MTSPAFQFYPDDFIGGTVDLSTEEVGAYIRLLCYQWGRGAIPTTKIALDRVAGCAVSDAVLEKFPNCKNKRLEKERKKQREYRAKQAINGAKGGRPRKPNPNPSLSFGLSQTEPKKSSPSPSPSPSPNGEGTPIANRISWEGELKRIGSELATYGQVSDYDKGSPIRARIPELKKRQTELRSLLGVIA